MLKQIDAINQAIPNLTPEQRARLAGAWRRSWGGHYALARARRVAINNQRDAALAAVRAAATAVSELEAKSSSRAAWEKVCAGQAAAETILALSLVDLIGTYIDQATIDKLLAPWRYATGTDPLAEA